MSKIKLSILLLISFFVFSCTNDQINDSNKKYSLAYIGGEYDGLLLKNYLTNGLKNLKIYDQNSSIEIQANISHISDLYITNIDNTSDREKINTKLSIKIINKKSNCISFNDEIAVSQFYIYASSDKFLSNQAAVKKIKKDNTESTVRQFINKLKKIDGQCNE
tara:strand:- start:617 stop:1105 length:489 start_codon:yes stop_codon:yes gene_type:complete